MEITLLIGQLSGGGAERVTCNLANYLVSKGHGVTILCISDHRTYYVDKRVNIVAMYPEAWLKIPHFIVNIIRLYRFNRYLRKARPDVYVTFLPGLTTKLMRQKGFVRCPIIIAERGDPSKRSEIYHTTSEKFFKSYQGAHGFVFQTKDAQIFYQKVGLNIDNSVIIPNAINPDFIRGKYEGTREKKIVGIGRMAEQKNFALLINAFSKISESIPEYKLVIYGDGPLLAEYKEMVRCLGLEKRIMLPGYTENIVEELQCASLFVLSSDYEGMPNALAEAMALGVPSISTDCPVGGARFLVQDGVNGLLVPVGDIGAMSSAMQRILMNADFAAKLGDNGRKIMNELTIEKVYGKWESFMINTVSGFEKGRG